MPIAIDGMMPGLRGLKSTAEAKSHYDQWAPSYDAELNKVYGYIGSSIIANTFGKDQIPRSFSILDVGCGTGLIGEELKKRGFLNLYGADFSENMLQEAGKKDVYRRLIRADFCKKTNILDGVYDTIIAVDCFGRGQCTAGSLNELIRIVRRSGLIYALVETEYFEDANFSAAIADLERRERWTIDRIMPANLMKNAVRHAKLIVAKRI